MLSTEVVRCRCCVVVFVFVCMSLLYLRIAGVKEGSAEVQLAIIIEQYHSDKRERSGGTVDRRSNKLVRQGIMG